MVKDKSELRPMGTTKPTVTISQESGGNIPDVYVAKDLTIHPTREGANARDREIERQIKSDQTPVGPDEFRKKS